MHRSLLTAALLAGACFAPVLTQAQAQDPPPARDETVPAPRTISADGNAEGDGEDEIVVTGQRRAPAAAARELGVLGRRRPIETPFSVNSIDREMIDNLQATTVSELLRADPSVNIARTRGNFAEGLKIRGFVMDSGGILYDGVFGPFAASALVQLETAERVDVLKGPATFLFGVTPFSAVGGVVNVVPKGPLADGFTELTGSYTYEGQLGARFDLSRQFQLADGLGVRATFGYLEGEAATEGIDEQNLFAGVRAVGTLGPVTATIDLGGFDRRIQAYQNNFTVAPGVRIPDAPDAARIYSPAWGFYDRQLFRALAGLEWQISEGWSLRGTLSQAQLFGEFVSPGVPQFLNPRDPVCAAVRGDCYRVTLSDGKTQDFATDAADVSLRGRVETGPLTHELTASYGIVDYEAKSSLYPGGSSLITSFVTGTDNPVFPPQPLRPRPFTTISSALVESSGWGVSDTIGLFDDRLQVLLGLRRTTIESRQLRFAPLGPIPAGTLRSASERSKTTPAVAVTFRPAPWLTLYGTYQDALERGGIAPDTARNRGETLPPIETTAREIGVKLEVGQMLLTAAAFEIEKGLEFTDATNLFVQDGLQVHRGAELAVSGSITPDLFLSGGAMYLDAEAARVQNPAFNGNRPAGVPELTLTLYADYEFAALPGLGINATAQYVSDQVYDLANDRKIPGWGRLDLGASYRGTLAGRPTTLRVAVENVFDADYWASADASALSLGAPLTVRATLSTIF